MTRIALSDIAAHDPDVLLPPDEEFAEQYAHAVRVGRELAAERSVAFVAICRNAMPWLSRTLALVEETGKMFADWKCHIVENDSTDGTKQALLTNGMPRISFEMSDNGRPHLSHTISQERTIALAEYRTRCQEWVRNSEPVGYVVVFDTDAWGGWSVDGVATSIYHMETDESWYGLASYSWCEMDMGGGRRFAGQYDAFALRLNHWRRRDQQWIHHWNPPAGSFPVELNSAFGQLAVYGYDQYVRGTYSGEDCEHVTFHRSIADAFPHHRFGLNPSSRCVSFWVPTDAGQHGDH
jgi:hypothetical protein